ncbi:MAG: tetratricopeptide repeat protein [Planctomycetota bacterium]|jgi:hypothetical protein|nr:tetratricopeptide repeat protein [Planctomycetota bacterium]
MPDSKNNTGPSLSQRLADNITVRASKIRWAFWLFFGVLIVALVAVTLVRNQRSGRLTDSENSLYQAQVDAFGRVDADPPAILGQVAENYRGLPAGAKAIMYAYAYQLGENNLEAAESLANDFLKTYPNSRFAPDFHLGLAKLLHNSGKTEEARREVEPLARQDGLDIYPEAALLLAEITESEAEPLADNPELQNQKLTEAREIYTNLVTQAQSRLYWPPSVRLRADFALLLLNDRMAGYRHPSPQGSPPAAASASITDMETLLNEIGPPVEVSGEETPATGVAPWEVAEPATPTPAADNNPPPPEPVTPGAAE